MKRCAALVFSAAIACGSADAFDNDRTLMEAQMLRMALPQCLLLDKAHAKRAQDGWRRWWKARSDALPSEYKRPLIEPARLESGIFAMTDADVLEVCEKSLAGLEGDAKTQGAEPQR